MKKKIIKLTESDLVSIVERVITEQYEEARIIKGVQHFLNQKLGTNLKIDGKTGPNSNTSKAIEKYQAKIGVYPTDGVWGYDTYRKMPEEDKKLFKKSLAEQGSIIDKFLNWIGVK